MHRSVALLLALVALVVASPASADPSSSLAFPDAYAKIDAGNAATCAVLTGGVVRCWGANYEGMLGLGSLARENLGDDEHPGTVGAVSLGEAATAVTVGGRHACAVLTSGTARCWGSGDQGQLGVGGTGDTGDNETPANANPVDLSGAAVKAISAGGEHTCAILSTDALRCWGGNDQGQLGVGDKSPRFVPTAVDLGPGRTAKAVTASGDHTCAILDTGAVKCWGDGAWGVTGLGSEADVTVPAQVFLPVGRTAAAIDTSSNNTCLILDDDTARCWGIGQSGKNGNLSSETIGDDELPGNEPAIALGGAAAAISVGEATSCAQLTSGAVRCWGDGGFGEFGNGKAGGVGDNETPASVPPVTPPAGQSIAALASGSEFRCFTAGDGTIRCTGYSASGQTGWPDATNDAGFLHIQDEPVAQTPPIRFAQSGADVDVRVERAGPGTIAVDGTTEVELQIRNTGPLAIDGAVGHVSWTAGMTVAGTSGSGALDTGTGDWTVGAMQPGDVRTLTVTFTGTTSGGKDVSLAMASVDGPADVDSTPGNGLAEDDADALDITVVPGADVSIATQVATTDIPVGGHRTMTVTVTNDGPSSADGVETLLVGDDSWYVGAASPSQGSMGFGGRWYAGTIAAGASATITFPLSAKTVGSKAVGAKIWALDTPDKDNTDHQSTHVVPIVQGADIELTTNPDSSAIVGQSGAGYVYAHHTGGATADVQVKMSIPAGLALDQVSGSGMTWDAASQTVTLAAFAPGQHRTVTFSYHGVAEGAHLFGAEVSSSTKLDPDSTPGNGIAAGEDDDVSRTAAFKPSPSSTTPAVKPPVTASTTTPAATQSTTRPQTTIVTRPQTSVNRPSVKVKRRVPTVTLSTNRPAGVVLAVQRWTGKRWVRVQQKQVTASPTRTGFRLKKLAKGRYRVTASVPGSARSQTVRFTVA
jgi:alpha-tubulin suppressor-like RCC1 family protein